MEDAVLVEVARVAGAEVAVAVEVLLGVALVVAEHEGHALDGDLAELPGRERFARLAVDDPAGRCPAGGGRGRCGTRRPSPPARPRCTA